MEILDNSILLFKNTAPKKLLDELDNYFTDMQINDRTPEKNGTEFTNQQINDFIKSEIEPKMLDYFLDLKHESRPDLQRYSWNYQLDKELYEKTGEMYNTLRNHLNFSIHVSCFKFVHRNNALSDSNYVRWIGDMNHFTFIIGISEAHKHVSTLRFPLQRVALQLNRGDVLVAPSGLTHPYIINDVQNGLFKFIEAL
jgi:hypothetical protein